MVSICTCRISRNQNENVDEFVKRVIQTSKSVQSNPVKDLGPEGGLNERSNEAPKVYHLHSIAFNTFKNNILGSLYIYEI